MKLDLSLIDLILKKRYLTSLHGFTYLGILQQVILLQESSSWMLIKGHLQRDQECQYVSLVNLIRLIADAESSKEILVSYLEICVHQVVSADVVMQLNMPRLRQVIERLVLSVLINESEIVTAKMELVHGKLQSNNGNVSLETRTFDTSSAVFKHPRYELL